VSLPPIAEGQTGSVEHEISDIERLKDEAYAKGDQDAFDRIYADDYVAINAAGGTSNKQDLMKFNTGLGRVMYDTHSSSEINVRVFSDSAVVTGTYSFKYKKPARGDDSGQYRYTSVYVSRAGKWQIVADQFTRITK
jgi:uncharacterized protein (TIGR02246 family)